MNGQRVVGIAPVVLFGFIRIATNRRVFENPLTTDEAIERVQRWLLQPNVTCLVPGTRHLVIAFGLLRSVGAAGNLTTDVQIAAHVPEHSGEVHSNDTDFGRFDGLRWVNPLTG